MLTTVSLDKFTCYKDKSGRWIMVAEASDFTGINLHRKLPYTDKHWGFRIYSPRTTRTMTFYLLRQTENGDRIYKCDSKSDIEVHILND